MPRSMSDILTELKKAVPSESESIDTLQQILSQEDLNAPGKVVINITKEEGLPGVLSVKILQLTEKKAFVVFQQPIAFDLPLAEIDSFVSEGMASGVIETVVSNKGVQALASRLVRLRQNKDLQHQIAALVYEKQRQLLTITSPEILPWDQLNTDEKNQFGQAVDFWLAGLGSNEVLDAWYERSGKMIPVFLRGIVPDDKVVWGSAALDAIFRLMDLAAESIRGNDDSSKS